MKKENKLSIITVCYNCENSVDKTLKSLMNQTYKDFEYIVIDGNSKDNTLENIKKYCENLENVIIKSEPDNGIYDAMNKGINLATGDFIYFLNIGDEFCDNNVLENVVANLRDNIIYYGDVIINNKQKKIFPDKITPLYFIEKGMICHQCIFTPINSLKNNLFDTSYTYCADENWLIDSIENKKVKYKHLNILICNYDTTGISSINEEKVFIESMNVKRKYYSNIIINLFCIKRAIKEFIKKLINRQ